MNQSRQMNTTPTETKVPNYRLYDCTGGGVTHDIYADSLEAAITAGREWIEDVDWSRGDYDKNGNFRQWTVKMDCCVREILRAVDMDAMADRCAHHVLHHEDDGTIWAYAERVEVERDQDTCDHRRLWDEGSESASLLAECAGDWAIIEPYTSEGDIAYRLTPTLAWPRQIDDDATDDGREWDCSGEYTSSQD